MSDADRTLRRRLKSLHSQRAAALTDAQQLEALLRAATNHSIVLTDSTGVITRFNEGAERLLGYPATEIIGRHTPDIFFEPGQLAEAAAEFGVEERYQRIAEAAVGDSHWTRDWIWLTASGEPVVVRLTVTEQAAGSGGAAGFLGIATDVTAEVESGAELAAAENRWRTLLESLPNTFVLVVDSDLRYRLAVGAGTDSLSTNPIAGRTVWEVSCAADATQLEALFRGALHGERRAAEVTLAGGDTFSMVAMPLWGQPDGPEALVIANNVTVDRRREDSLRSAQARFRRLFEEAPNGAAIFDLDGTFRQVNPALCALLGRSPDELTGKPATVIAPATGDFDIQRHFTELLASPTGRQEGDWTVQHRDRRPVHLSASSVVLREENGAPESILCNLVDISQRRQYEQHLSHLADHDPLTGLVNRRRFDLEVTAHLERCRRYGANGALIVLDLDHFKQVNDTLGHGVGDQLIVSTADVLKHRLRTTDIVSRMGGDEFAILLTNVDRAAAEGVADSIVKLIRSEVSVFDRTGSRHVTTSVGIALISGKEASGSELMSIADHCMYDAKESGRDRYVLFDPSEQHGTRPDGRLAWSDRIASALAEGRFVLEAQPLMNLDTKRVDSAELLVRMNEPDGLVMPSDFLYVAERLGQAAAIDSWVITSAVDLLAEIVPVAPDFRVHVNLSGQSVTLTENTLHHIAAQIHRTGVDASRLVFEVSETTAVANMESTRTLALGLRELGCAIALDNFGAGLGSFYYLKHLHFDYLKVDGEFVAKCATNETDRLILDAIVTLAKGMRTITVAEHVEDLDSLSIVAGAGLNYAQGYHLDRPESLGDLHRRLGSIAANEPGLATC